MTTACPFSMWSEQYSLEISSNVKETGDIIERQRDRETGEWKYLVRGQTIEGVYIVVITKLSPTGKMVIITVFSEE